MNIGELPHGDLWCSPVSALGPRDCQKRVLMLSRSFRWRFSGPALQPSRNLGSDRWVKASLVRGIAVGSSCGLSTRKRDLGLLLGYNVFFFPSLTNKRKDPVVRGDTNRDVILGFLPKKATEIYPYCRCQSGETAGFSIQCRVNKSRLNS